MKQIKLSDLSQDKRNANKGTTEGHAIIEKSLSKLGTGRSIVVDKNGVIIAGNKTAIAAQSAGIDDATLVESDGTKLIVVQRTDLDLQHDSKAKELAIADNRASELSLNWDEDILLELSEEISVCEWFSGSEIESWGPVQDKIEEDLDEIVANCKGEDLYVSIGDVWFLGDHVLICRDSSIDDYFLKNSYDVVVYDPPWDASFDKNQFYNRGSQVLAFCDGATLGQVISYDKTCHWLFVWDCVSSWYTPNRPLRRGKFCLWMSDSSNISYNPDGAFYGDPNDAKTVSNSRGTYDYVPDPRGKHLSDVFSSPITRLHSDGSHKHEKPLDWIRMLIGNCSGSGNIFDPFLGSGTSLIAAEQLGRVCHGYEIDPFNCQIIIERWQAITGIDAVKADG